MADYDAQSDRRPSVQPELSPAQIEADELDLHAGLAGVAGIVVDARQVTEILRDVAEFAARAIPGVDGAAVTLIRSGDEKPRIPTSAVTAAFVAEIDAVQYEDLGEGPCITCMDSRRPAVSGSLGSDSRWPRFGGRVARMGVHSALALPLLITEEVVGAIDCFAFDRNVFDEHAVRLGAQFAGLAAVSVYKAQLLVKAWDR